MRAAAEGETKVVETFRTNYECKAGSLPPAAKPLHRRPGEDKYLFDKGISFCATRDAAANTGKTVMVIGSGDAAIEEGMFSPNLSSRVPPRDARRGQDGLQRDRRAEAMENPKMSACTLPTGATTSTAVWP